MESSSPSLLDPVWEHGYEYRVPNEYDEALAGFKARHAGEVGFFLGRSPWLDDDMSRFNAALAGPCVKMTANLGVNHHRVRYCYHGFDPEACRAIDIKSRPEVVFFAGASQKAVEYQREKRHHNLYLHTDPPVVPKFFQHLGDTTYPRPWNCLVSGHRAVWFLHFLGCNPIVLLGVDFAGRNGTYYGDGHAPTAEGIDAENNRLWKTRMAELVEALREKGVDVLWPGENRKRETEE